MTLRSFRFFAAGTVGALLFLAGGGCGDKPPTPVDISRAEETLSRVLDGWKSGAKPEDFQKQEPPVIVQDFEWLGGAKLVSYEPARPAEAINAQLHCPMKIVVRGSDGKESTKEVTYMVATDPVLGVFRELKL